MQRSNGPNGAPACNRTALSEHHGDNRYIVLIMNYEL